MSSEATRTPGACAAACSAAACTRVGDGVVLQAVRVQVLLGRLRQQGAQDAHRARPDRDLAVDGLAAAVGAGRGAAGGLPRRRGDAPDRRLAAAVGVADRPVRPAGAAAVDRARAPGTMPARGRRRRSRRGAARTDRAGDGGPGGGAGRVTWRPVPPTPARRPPSTPDAPFWLNSSGSRAEEEERSGPPTYGGRLLSAAIATARMRSVPGSAAGHAVVLLSSSTAPRCAAPRPPSAPLQRGGRRPAHPSRCSNALPSSCARQTGHTRTIGTNTHEN